MGLIKNSEVKLGDVIIAPMYWDDSDETLDTMLYYDGEQLVVVSEANDQELIDKALELHPNVDLLKRQLTVDTFTIGQGFPHHGIYQFNRIGNIRDHI